MNKKAELLLATDKRNHQNLKSLHLSYARPLSVACVKTPYHQ